ncbi:MAG: ABC transporter substrate-binding protein [Desulfobacterales bacterium]|nr:ABC transporter substrate-binding protein [Desulfobacterales bacterium]MCP4162010.1 ABC transporter substrate-binding protein [Deltaproteobacteria bacterium]
MYLTKISEPILREAYQQLDIQIKVRLAPGERAITEANSGNWDGDLIRKAGLEKKYRNLVMIPVSLVTAEWVVFSKKRFPVHGWKSIRPYNIVIQRGLRVAEDGTHGMKVMAVTSIIQMFKMIDIDRADIAVSTRLEGTITIKKLGLSGINLLEPSLQHFPLYHYIHNKHKKKVPELTNILRNMEQRGRIKAIKEEVLNSLLGININR